MKKKYKMNVDYFEESPYYSIISFHKLIEALQQIAQNEITSFRVEYANSLLKEVARVPELHNGITSKEVIFNNIELIHHLLSDLFPTALTNNEIKAVSLPFQNFNFNFTKRFQQILDDAGESFQINIRDFLADDFYIMSCCMILNKHYNENFDISSPLFYDIPDKEGIIKHYRIIYNADFVELLPTEKAIELTEDDIKLLKSNFNNIALWKEKFPNHSWILKGFGIVTLFDVTFENSISNLKSNLIKADSNNRTMSIIETSFKSIFKIADLRVGIVFLNHAFDEFFSITKEMQINSFFNDAAFENNLELKQQCIRFFVEVQKATDFYCVSDIDELILIPEISLYAQFLKSKNIESFILAKLHKVDNFQGFIEVISSKKFALNSVNAKKLNDVLPLINDTVDRIENEIKNQFEAIIQREFTTIHPSVYWKFLDEARKYFRTSSIDKHYTFNEIEFEAVYPLFGETDIKGSSYLRNLATKTDLTNHLLELVHLFDFVKSKELSLVIEQRSLELNRYLTQINDHFDTYSEFQIQNYIIEYIHPILNQFVKHKSIKSRVENYFDKLDESRTKYCSARKVYDETITLVNKNLSEIIDSAQQNIQKIFPHYFERFKSDGVEYNAFIGASISPNLIYDDLYLSNLRLWQIQVMCEMIRKHHQFSTNFDLTIELTSLIFVYNLPVNIRFRFDEKRFDVASSSDVRFQMIKKRLDKSHVKNSNQRIVQPRMLTIVYLNESDQLDYQKYIDFLKSKNYLSGETECIEIEDLQDVSGLRALRILINLTETEKNSVYYSFSDLN